MKYNKIKIEMAIFILNIIYCSRNLHGDILALLLWYAYCTFVNVAFIIFDIVWDIIICKKISYYHYKKYNKKISCYPLLIASNVFIYIGLRYYIENAFFFFSYIPVLIPKIVEFIILSVKTKNSLVYKLQKYRIGRNSKAGAYITRIFRRGIFDKLCAGNKLCNKTLKKQIKTEVAIIILSIIYWVIYLTVDLFGGFLWGALCFFLNLIYIIFDIIWGLSCQLFADFYEREYGKKIKYFHILIFSSIFIYIGAGILTAVLTKSDINGDSIISCIPVIVPKIIELVHLSKTKK